MSLREGRDGRKDRGRVGESGLLVHVELRLPSPCLFRTLIAQTMISGTEYQGQTLSADALM